MAFLPFDASDFQSMQQVGSGQPLPAPLEAKVEELRRELGQFPEFDLEFFRKKIVRRPRMRGKQGLVFTEAKPGDQHWYLYIVNGDQDQVQLNVGMFPDTLRVGLGFQIGRQVNPKMPAFHLFQHFLGARPPLPFRDAFLRCVERNGFAIEDIPTANADELLHRLETYVVPADKEPTFVFVGSIWDIAEAGRRQVADYRHVFLELMPFYEELVLAGGRYVFYP